jgi:hypothetical protein
MDRYVAVDDVIAIAERKIAGDVTDDEAVAMLERLGRGDRSALRPVGDPSADLVDRVRAMVARGELTAREGDEIVAELRYRR